jgi:hypothetical protein
MSDIVERLRQGVNIPHVADGVMDEAADEIEWLRANQERMWCKSCGAVTRSGECDCTRTGSTTQNLVNYADSLNDDARALSAINAELLGALEPFAKVANGSSLLPTEAEWQRTAVAIAKAEGKP